MKQVDILRHNAPEIVAGGLNAKSQQWGETRYDKRGSVITKWMTKMDMVVANTRDEPKFKRRESLSIIDPTLVSINSKTDVQNLNFSDKESQKRSLLHNF